MAAVRAAGVDAFGVNLFVPGAPTADPAGLAAYLAQLEPDAAVVGVALGEASWDDDDYAGKVDAVLAAPPAAVSFTFGIPEADVVRGAAGGGLRRPAHRHDARGGGRRAAGGSRRAVPAGRRGRRPPGQPGQRRPPG